MKEKYCYNKKDLRKIALNLLYVMLLFFVILLGILIGTGKLISLKFYTPSNLRLVSFLAVGLMIVGGFIMRIVIPDKEGQRIGIKVFILLILFSAGIAATTFGIIPKTILDILNTCLIAMSSMSIIVSCLSLRLKE